MSNRTILRYRDGKLTAPVLRPWIAVCLLTCVGALPGRGGETLVVNGGFEQADPKNREQPLGWELPDGLGIKWAKAPTGADGKRRGMAICMDTSVTEKAIGRQREKKGITGWEIPNPGGNAIADTYGLSFYSQTIPVEEGRSYRVTFDFKGAGGGKVWVRAYGMYRGQMRRRYEALVNCRGANDEWTRFSDDFSPTKHRPEVTEMKVMLYAFYPAGEYWFDNIRIEALAMEEQTKEGE